MEYVSRSFKCEQVNCPVIPRFLIHEKFVEPQVLQNSGYKSRKAMKRAMFQRAKVRGINDLSTASDKFLQVPI